MPSRCHQLQQLVATRRRQQQLPQTNVENGKLLSVLRRSKAGGHGQGPIRPARSGGTESSHHGKGWLPLTPSAGMEVMVAVVDGRRRRGPVYVRYFLYYSYLRHTRYLFLVVGGQKNGFLPEPLKRNPVNTHHNASRTYLAKGWKYFATKYHMNSEALHIHMKSPV